MFFSTFFAATALASTAFAAVTPQMHVDSSPNLSKRALTSGDGTFYTGGWQDGACSFTDYVLPTGIGSTCVSQEIWNNGSNCGGCVAITYGGKTIKAMVTNLTGGDKNHLDMDPVTFAELAPKSKGEIDIQWEFVPCPITTPLTIHMHGGSSKYWFAATVQNATRRTVKLEVSADQGKTWKNTERQKYNYFLLNGGTGTTTAWVRLTSYTGTQVVVKDVNVSSGAETKAAGNYA